MTALYPRLAVTGIRKNSKLYFPYIGTCIGMVTMYYIIHSLSFSPTLREMKGGGTMEAILGLGVFVIAIFAVIFLHLLSYCGTDRFVLQGKMRFPPLCLFGILLGLFSHVEQGI